jgi:hypothetical protein
MGRKKNEWTIPTQLRRKILDKEQFYRRLKFGDIKGGTYSTTVAAQDQARSTNYFKKSARRN